MQWNKGIQESINVEALAKEHGYLYLVGVMPILKAKIKISFSSTHQIIFTPSYK